MVFGDHVVFYSRNKTTFILNLELKQIILELMRIWAEALVRSEKIKFSQELDPFTGEMSKGCEWYSATMLFFIHGIKRLLY